MAVNLSLGCLILTCSLKHHKYGCCGNRGWERQPYVHQTVNGYPTERTVTDANAHQTEFSGFVNRTADANDRTKPRRVYKTYGNGHGPNRKHTFLQHKQRITALVTQQYTATQQVYTRVHTIYTTTQPSIQSLQYQLHVKHHVYNNTARPLGLEHTYEYYYTNKHTQQ